MKYRSNLDDFLMASLDGAVALVQVHHVAVCVAHDLHFDVARLFHVLFDEDGPVAEGGLGFRVSAIEGLFHILRREKNQRRDRIITQKRDLYPTPSCRPSYPAQHAFPVHHHRTRLWGWSANRAASQIPRRRLDSRWGEKCLGRPKNPGAKKLLLRW